MHFISDRINTTAGVAHVNVKCQTSVQKIINFVTLVPLVLSNVDILWKHDMK